MTTLPLRADLVGIAPYGAPEDRVPVRLNVNENPYSPAPEIIADIADSVTRAATDLNRYPDRDFPALRAALADYLTTESHVTVDPQCVWAANGSNEVMLHLFQAFGGPGRVALSFAPTYAMYPEYARDTNTGWVVGTRGEDFSLDVAQVEAALQQHRPSLLVLASPNNPSGTALPPGDLAQIVHAAQSSGPDIDGQPSATIVIVDEAYGEFRREGVPSALETTRGCDHVVVTRTMSKAFAMAGLRLGYMVAPRPIIDAVAVVRLPYHLSAITQAVALAALRHAPQLMAQVADLRRERDELVDWLEERGLRACESDANFVLFGPIDNRDAVFQALLDRGILIRVVGPPGWMRVSIGTPDEMLAFKNALTEVLP
ncbi:MAG: histidinol-phosphate transaminase [Actinomycetaceae bacterium]|nr:histidinol-phosphate transaminase [Actinomycetaceae bacterium]